jgi:poly(A) polymerase
LKSAWAAPVRLVEQARFRAAFDFMRLRADVGEVDVVLADWWQEFSVADDATRHAVWQAVAAARLSEGNFFEMFNQHAQTTASSRRHRAGRFSQTVTLAGGQLQAIPTCATSTTRTWTTPSAPRTA